MNGTKQVAAPIDEETRAHLERTSKLRFRRSIIAGISGPIIFGLVVAFSGPLIAAALEGAVLASLGIGAAAVLAVGCLYLNSRIDSNISQADQEYQALKIAKGIGGPVLPAIEQKPISFPAQNNAHALAAVPAASAEALSNQPTLVVNNVANMGRAVAPALEAARGQA